VELLRAMGHEGAYNLRGGITAWVNRRKPVERGG
jgi:rhodanese-related sulfurtransferase